VSVLRALESEDIAIIRQVHYHQYDTYFFFGDPEQGRLRYPKTSSSTSRIRSSMLERG
jgi:hypothetical protein